MNEIGLESAIVSVHNPIVLSDSEPEPDLALLRPREDFYETEKPTARDVVLVIEVADSSLAYYREIKLPLYAQAGIQELWIVNLNESKVEVYRQPKPEGTYLSRVDFSRGETIISPGFLDVPFEIDSILG